LKQQNNDTTNNDLRSFDQDRFFWHTSEIDT